MSKTSEHLIPFFFFFFFFFLPSLLLFFFIYLSHKVLDGMANSVDPGQTAPRDYAYVLNVQNQDFKLFGLKLVWLNTERDKIFP